MIEIEESTCTFYWNEDSPEHEGIKTQILAILYGYADAL